MTSSLCYDILIKKLNLRDFFSLNKFGSLLLNANVDKGYKTENIFLNLLSKLNKKKYYKMTKHYYIIL